MEGKKRRGRQKIEMKIRESEDDRLITFSKRRSGIYKKANELATLCGAEIAFVVFSPSGKPFSFGHPNIKSITNRFLLTSLPKDDAFTQPIVESNRQARIDELNQQHNELVEQFEHEKAQGKVLEKKLKATKREGCWDTPLEELFYEELKQTEESWLTLQNNLIKMFQDKNGEAASSANFSFPPIILCQDSTSLVTKFQQFMAMEPWMGSLLLMHQSCLQ